MWFCRLDMKWVNVWHGRDLLRLPPFPLVRLERAFLDGGSEEPLLKDLHLCLLRVLEGVDVELHEAPTMAGYGAAAELGPKEVYRCTSNTKSRPRSEPSDSAYSTI